MSARIPMFLALFVMGGQPGFSADAGAEKFAPETYPIDRYQQIWKRSPFIKETESVTQSAGLATKYGLVGMSSLNKLPIVFLWDKNEADAVKSRFMVSKAKPDAAHNIELISVTMDKDPRKSTAIIKQGAEQASLTFDASALQPTGATASMPSPGYPGIPLPSGQVPPAPFQPGGITAPSGLIPLQPGGITAPPVPNASVRLNRSPIDPTRPGQATPPPNPGLQIPPPPTPPPTRRIILRPKPINVD